jgi:hypothetical protein
LLLAVFLGLDTTLVALDQTAVPKRDLLASCVSLVILVEGFSLKRHIVKPSATPNPAMKRRLDKMFRMFHILSAIELLTMIILPWGMILNQKFYGNDSLEEKESAIYLLASHLFIFQTQIAEESLIAAAGSQHRWMIFPFTVLANTYRLVPLLTWLSRSGYKVGQPTLQQHPLPWIGLALWIFSSFYFIPFEWWPRQQDLHH